MFERDYCLKMFFFNLLIDCLIGCAAFKKFHKSSPKIIQKILILRIVNEFGEFCEYIVDSMRINVEIIVQFVDNLRRYVLRLKISLVELKFMKGGIFTSIYLDFIARRLRIIRI